MKIVVSKRARSEWELSWHVASHLSLPWELCSSLQPLSLVVAVAVAVVAVAVAAGGGITAFTIRAVQSYCGRDLRAGVSRSCYSRYKFTDNKFPEYCHGILLEMQIFEHCRIDRCTVHVRAVRNMTHSLSALLP